ncbi:MAG: hypothetical protein DRP10_00915 [Candidatus Aenigmatarchaeota archaeon]|nr:MAG: hypothetical protein DRP10_00915 [Candidatus Aenigmarchaeota archaeon]
MFEGDINGNPGSEMVDPIELLKIHDIYCGVYEVPLDGIHKDISIYKQGMLEKMGIKDISLGYVEEEVKFAAEYLENLKEKLKGKGIEYSLNDVEEEVKFAAEYLENLKEKLKGKGIEDISLTDVEKRYEKLSKDYESFLNNTNLFFSGGEKMYEDSLKIKREIYNLNRSFTEEIKELNEYWSILKELLLTTLMLKKSLNEAEMLSEEGLQDIWVK